MGRGLRWVLQGLAGLLVVVVALWVASRLWGMRPEQRAALALMRAEWTPAGRNAFEAIWTFRHDVPVAQQRAITQADMRSLRDSPPFGTTTSDFRSAALAYPDLSPADADREKFCAASKPGCLAMVAADLPGYAALVDRNARLVARADALAGFDHVKFLLPSRLDVPLPAFVDTYLPATRDALLFAQGYRQEALRNTCRGIATWRRYATNSNMLITSMVALSYSANGYGGLFADMLAASPAGTPIPDECGLALAPVRPGELSLCEAMRGEFAFGDNAVRDLRNAPGGQSPGDSWIARRLLLDAEGTSALNAAYLSAACTRQTTGMIERDVPIRALSAERAWNQRFECIANAVGCILSEIAKPGYVSYFQRMQDYGMKLRVLGTLLWLHQNPRPDASLAERLRQRPPHLRSPAREIALGDDGKSLRIQLHEASQGEWSQPLRP